MSEQPNTNGYYYPHIRSNCISNRNLIFDTQGNLVDTNMYTPSQKTVEYFTHNNDNSTYEVDDLNVSIQQPTGHIFSPKIIMENPIFELESMDAKTYQQVSQWMRDTLLSGKNSTYRNNDDNDDDDDNNNNNNIAYYPKSPVYSPKAPYYTNNNNTTVTLKDPNIRVTNPTIVMHSPHVVIRNPQIYFTRQG